MPFIFLSLSLFAVLTFPQLSAKGGMFFDGVTYSAIARNLAEGVGTFWRPHYTETTYPAFYEHPPLAFALQSIIYRLFGDAFFVDVLWGIFLGALTLAGLALYWRRLTQWQEDDSSGSWWPLFLWLQFPLVSWALKNNAIENIVTVLILFSALLSDLSLHSPSRRKMACFSLLAGALMAAAFFCKGPVALFVLIAPALRVLTYPQLGARRGLGATLGLFAGAALFTALLFLPNLPTALEAFQAYANQQVVKSLQGMRELSPSRFYLLKRLATESLIPLFVAGGLSLLFKRFEFRDRDALYFTLLGLAGSLPLLISPKQMGWYLVPSFPFFALAIAQYSRGAAKEIEKRVRKNLIWGLTAALLLMTVGLLFLGKGRVTRDRQMYEDLVLQEIAVKPRARVTVCPEDFMSHWSLIAVLQRFQRVSLTTENTSYWLQPVDSSCRAPETCSPLQKIPPKRYALFSCPLPNETR